jgi:DNA modification methylase
MKLGSFEIDKVYARECIEAMREIPPGSIDMILCDLPFGKTACSWDVVIPFPDLWECYERIIKPNGAIVLFGKEPFSSYLRISNAKRYRYDWIWEKTTATGHLNANRMPMQAHENLSVFYKRLPVYNPQMTTGHKPMSYAIRKNTSVYGSHGSSESRTGATNRYPRDVLCFPPVNNNSPEKVHETQKPVPLLEYMIKTYTHPGHIILDNCMGSGATAEAAKRTGRNFLGFDNGISEKLRIPWADYANQRVELVAQGAEEWTE